MAALCMRQDQSLRKMHKLAIRQRALFARGADDVPHLVIVERTVLLPRPDDRSIVSLPAHHDGPPDSQAQTGSMKNCTTSRRLPMFRRLETQRRRYTGGAAADGTSQFFDSHRLDFDPADGGYPVSPCSRKFVVAPDQHCLDVDPSQVSERLRTSRTRRRACLR